MVDNRARNVTQQVSFRARRNNQRSDEKPSGAMTYTTTAYMRRDIFGGRTISLPRYRMAKAGYHLIDSLVTLISVWSIMAAVTLSATTIASQSLV
jgi:hypothetical protein